MKMLESRKVRKILNASLWGAQVLMAAVFGMAGAMKAFTPIAELAEKLPWVTEVSESLVRFIGISELIGALGLLIPPFIHMLPWFLTPLASLGLTIIMVLAAGFHGMRGEMSALPVNLILGLILLFISYGRFFKVPLYPQVNKYLK